MTQLAGFGRVIKGTPTPVVTLNTVIRSRWLLDETSGTVAADQLGVQNGTYVNCSLGRDPIVVGGVHSTSCDGSTAAIQILDNAVHHIAELSVGGYFQVRAMPAPGTNQILFHKGGDSGSHGGVSVEIYNNGGQLRLRAYKTDASAGLVTLGAWPAGVADLTLGTAFRVYYTVNSLGSNLYLNNTLVASVADNRGWQDNTFEFAVMAWYTGAGRVSGLVERFEVWEGALVLDGGVLKDGIGGTALPNAQSVSESLPAGTLPQVPSMDFLSSDATLPAGTKIYVYDTNLGSGSGADAANAKEIQAAINAATAGQSLIAIASVAGGVSSYNRTSGLTFPNSGASGNPITLMARPGDTVIIDKGLEFASYRSSSSGSGTKWELFDSSKKIWRSVSTGFGSTVTPISGHWFEFGAPHYIEPAPNLTSLQAPIGVGKLWNNYSGPCACIHSDGRVYMRMQIPDPARLSPGGKWPKQAGGVFGEWPGSVNSSGQIAFPVTQDPRDYSIWMTRAPSSSGGGHGFHFNSGASYWTIGPGVNSVGFGVGIWSVGNNNNITFKRGTDLPFGWGMYTAGAGTGWLYDRRRMGTGSLRHLPLLDFKFGGALEANYRAAGMETNWQVPDNFQNLTCQNCTFYGFHDMAVIGGRSWKFIQCTFNKIFDDGFQCDIGRYGDLEFHYCYFLDSSVGGPGSHGVNTGSNKYSHCIIDARLCKKFDVTAEEPFTEGVDPVHVDWAYACSDPRKIYNCTFIVPPESCSLQAGCLAYHIRGAKNVSSTEYHEYWNNIACTVSENRYVGQVAQAWLGPSDGPIYRIISRGTQEAHDFCMIWRDCPVWPGTNAFVNGLIMSVDTADTGEQNFYTIAAWKGSGYFTNSKAMYSPGHHNSSVMEDPQIPSAVRNPASFDIRRDYRPRNLRASTLARTATSTTLSGQSTSGWYSQPSPWMGALDPNGTDCPVGVQNP